MDDVKEIALVRKEVKMVRSREDILNAIKERFADDTSDETIALIEDVSDTLDDYETKTNDTTDWKEKYETNLLRYTEHYPRKGFNRH